MSASKPSSSITACVDDAAHAPPADQGQQRQPVEVARRVDAEGAARDGASPSSIGWSAATSAAITAPMLVPPTKSTSMPLLLQRLRRRPGGQSRARRRRPAPGRRRCGSACAPAAPCRAPAPGRMCTCSATGRRASQAAVPRGQRRSAGCSSTRISAASARGGRCTRQSVSIGVQRAAAAWHRPAAAVSSQWRLQRRVHGVGVASASSSTKSCVGLDFVQLQRDAAVERDVAAPLPLAAPGSPQRRVERAAIDHDARGRLPASCAASSSAKPRRSTPSVTGSRPIVTGAAQGCGCAASAGGE